MPPRAQAAGAPALIPPEQDPLGPMDEFQIRRFSVCWRDALGRYPQDDSPLPPREEVIAAFDRAFLGQLSRRTDIPPEAREEFLQAVYTP